MTDQAPEESIEVMRARRDEALAAIKASMESLRQDLPELIKSTDVKKLASAACRANEEVLGYLLQGCPPALMFHVVFVHEVLCGIFDDGKLTKTNCTKITERGFNGMLREMGTFAKMLEDMSDDDMVNMTTLNKVQQCQNSVVH